jgi:hypothetical protein
MKIKDLLKILKQDGWMEKNQKGQIEPINPRKNNMCIRVNARTKINFKDVLKGK